MVLFSSVKGMHRFLYIRHTYCHIHITLKINISINKFYKCSSCCEVVIGAYADGQRTLDALLYVLDLKVAFNGHFHNLIFTLSIFTIVHFTELVSVIFFSLFKMLFKMVLNCLYYRCIDKLSVW